MFKAGQVKKPLLYVTSDHPHKRSNSAVLLCAYMVPTFIFFDGCIQEIVFYVYFQIFVLNYSMERAYAPFLGRSALNKKSPFYCIYLSTIA